MKRYISYMALVCMSLLIACQATNAQSLSKAELKEVKKQAKVLKKEGWKVFPGARSMETQLQRCLMKDDGSGRYLIASQQAKGQNTIAASKSAMNAARSDIASQISTEINEEITTRIENSDRGEDGIESLAQFISEGQSSVSRKLTGTKPCLEVYKELKGGLVEVSIRMPYDYEKAKKDMKKALLKKAMAENASNNSNSVTNAIEELYGGDDE